MLAVVLAVVLASAAPVETPAQVVALCETVAALPDGASTPPRRILLAPDGLILAPDAPDGPRLALSDRAQLAGAAGLLHVWIPGEAPLAVDVDDAAAARLRDAARRRTLTVALTFVAGGAVDGDPGCVRPAGARAYVLRVAPLGWEYRDGETIVARGGAAAEPERREPVRDGRPVVEIAGASGESADEVRRAVETRRPALVACYRAALRRAPALDGAVVAEIQLDRPGDPGAVRIALTAVQDEGLPACVRGALASARFPAGQGRTQVPIRFSLRESARTPSR